MTNVYNSRSKNSRDALAHSLRTTLKTAGFSLLMDSVGAEEVYFRDEGRFRVKVYTTIRTSGVGEGHARPKGEDSIKVCATRNTGSREIGWIKTTRVHRTGEIENISSRMLSRMREAWGDAQKRCREEGIR